MQRSSPGVRRIAAILNFIADHPGRGFTLIDLVRALQLSRSTCHALLTGLVEVGYLSRTSDKAYVLGPSLIGIGSIATSLTQLEARADRQARFPQGRVTWIGEASSRRCGRTS